MKISILKESADGETRVAAVPDTVTKLIGLGHAVTVEHDAGLQAGALDAAYEAAGA
ncbi:MAG: NAD(P)(+) transhydrogenase (Re/Si-specific) subunit alpha, partial [Pseudomonadota bacterium]